MDTQKLEQTGINNKKSKQLEEELRQESLEILKKSKFKDILKKHNIPETDLTIRVCVINSPELKKDSLAVKEQEIQNLSSRIANTDSALDGCIRCVLEDGEIVCYPCICPC